MKRWILIAMLCLGLAGCGASNTDTEEIEQATLDYLKKAYHITNAEVLSIERSLGHGSTIVILFDYILNSPSYDVIVQVNDSIPIIMEGTFYVARSSFQENNYVDAKHETLQEKSEPYIKLLNELENMRIVVERVTEGYDKELYHRDIRLLEFKLQAKTPDLHSEEVVEHLQKLSEHILENNDVTFEMNLQVPLHFYKMGEFTEEFVEIELTHARDQKIVEKLNEHLHLGHLTNQVNNQLIKEIESFNMELYRSQLEKDYHSNRDDSYYHKLTLAALEGFENNDFLSVMNVLREKGFDETYVDVSFTNGYSEICQVKQVKILRDVSRCFGSS